MTQRLDAGTARALHTIEGAQVRLTNLDGALRRSVERYVAGFADTIPEARRGGLSDRVRRASRFLADVREGDLAQALEIEAEPSPEVVMHRVSVLRDTFRVPAQTGAVEREVLERALRTLTAVSSSLTAGRCAGSASLEQAGRGGRGGRGGRRRQGLGSA